MDELTSNVSEQDASPSPSPSSEQATPTSAAAETTPQQSAGQTPKVNLFESQEFRNYQSQMNRQLAEVQRANQQYQQQLHAVRMEQMDDLEKANYTAEQYRLAYEEQVQNQERQQLEWQRWQILQDLSTRTGVPVETLQGATTPKEAYELAIAEMGKQVEKVVNARAADLAKRMEANKPDIGGGTVGSASDSELSRAITNKDSKAYYRLLLQGGG